MTTIPTAYPGLTSAEVADCVRRGQVNRRSSSELADYARIVARNLFTIFNCLVVPAAVALFAIGKLQGALAVSGMAIINTALGLAQELRAKRQLARLAILTQTTARVRRDGREMTIAADDVVAGDLVLVRGGEAIVADGPLIESLYLDVDEALLTGESDPVRRAAGDHVLSGSFAVAGEGSYQAEGIGKSGFAQSTAEQARSYRYAPSPLVRALNRLVNALTCAAICLCGIYLILYWLGRCGEDELIQNMAATITSMIPQGLVLTATLAFTIGAVRLSLQGAVVQRLSAVESMAGINVLCTDKTGTLTTNRLTLDRATPIGAGSAEDAGHLLALFASASVDQQSRVVLALKSALGELQVDRSDALPFQSKNRASAVRVRAGAADTVLVLGACEAVMPHLTPGMGAALEIAWKDALPSGQRLLIFGEADPAGPLGDTLAGLAIRPLLMLGFRDQVRPRAEQVLADFARQGIDLKIISGDNPDTIRATLAPLGLDLARSHVTTGDELDKAADFAARAAEASVFGRVSPRQKLEIVRALQARGLQVAMIGDGVNDVLPIKAADLGIAMGEGSQAAKTVASLVLQTNDFALLPAALDEGRLIVRNLRRAAKLFLTKNVFSLFLALAYVSGAGSIPFPYAPQQVTLLNWLVIGIPAMAMALSRARACRSSERDFLPAVGWFALRTGLTIALAGASAALATQLFFTADLRLQRTILLSVLIVLGGSVVYRALNEGDGVAGWPDRFARWWALAALPIYAAVMYIPFAAAFFELTPLRASHWAVVAAGAAVAWAVSLATDRFTASGQRQG
jgi:cation-transporting P-type ATPase E